MIKINLLGEKGDYAAAAMLQLFVYGVLVVGVIGTFAVIQSGAGDRLALASKEQAKLEQELRQLTVITRKVQGLEEKKNFLSEKLRTIASLKAKKRGPVRVLDELNSSLPERAWVVSLKEKAGTVEISGVALDNQTIAIFMNNLSQSKYFADVDLVHSTQHVVDNVKLKQFVLLARLEDLLKLQQQSEKVQEVSVDDVPKKYVSAS